MKTIPKKVLSALLSDTFLGIVFSLLSLAVSFGLLLPSIAVSVRRLHDIGKSGWMLFTIVGFLAAMLGTIIGAGG
ncbi:DUF805 domain-containing protein, partial [Veillonella parvula]|uniref:DUF805 domain-containing protein n=1 Tax=Veillonella parvula TaxID=29466 RepID=UPI00210F07B0